jgi:hypothetical protein
MSQNAGNFLTFCETIKFSRSSWDYYAEFRISGAEPWISTVMALI